MQSCDTRGRIVQATEQAIHRYGMARITTKRIAKIADIAEGTIFRHFKSKKALLLAALRYRGIPHPNIPDPEMANVDAVRDNLKKVEYCILRHYADVVPSAVASLADIDLLPDHRKWLQEHPFGGDRVEKAVLAYVLHEQQLGRVRGDVEPSFVSEMLLGNCLRRVLGRIFYRNSINLGSDEDFVDRLAEQLTNVIAVDNK